MGIFTQHEVWTFLKYPTYIIDN